MLPGWHASHYYRIFVKNNRIMFVLCSISDAQGNLVVQEVAVKPLSQDLLNHEVRLLVNHGKGREHVKGEGFWWHFSLQC